MNGPTAVQNEILRQVAALGIASFGALYDGDGLTVDVKVSRDLRQTVSVRYVPGADLYDVRTCRLTSTLKLIVSDWRRITVDALPTAWER